MLQATERRIELELEDAERWMRSIDGQPVDVTTADRRDLVRVLQRTDVWAALLME